MKITDKYVLFWGGIYSQWFIAPMQIDGIVYNSCEQYMMHQKALLFKDHRIADLIMQEENPREQKKYGRMISGFDKSVWEKNCLSIVYKGNMAKFTQNPKLKSELLKTGNRIMVEASPVDTIWGIGRNCEDVEATDPALWQGTNLLGQAITLVKNQLTDERIL